MYGVWFTNKNGYNEYLDNDGFGFTEEVSYRIGRQLENMGCTEIRFIKIAD